MVRLSILIGAAAVLVAVLILVSDAQAKDKSVCYIVGPHGRSDVGVVVAMAEPDFAWGPVELGIDNPYPHIQLAVTVVNAGEGQDGVAVAERTLEVQAGKLKAAKPDRKRPLPGPPPFVDVEVPPRGPSP